MASKPDTDKVVKSASDKPRQPAAAKARASASAKTAKPTPVKRESKKADVKKVQEAAVAPEPAPEQRVAERPAIRIVEKVISEEIIMPQQPSGTAETSAAPAKADNGGTAPSVAVEGVAITLP